MLDNSTSILKKFSPFSSSKKVKMHLTIMHVFTKIGYASFYFIKKVFRIALLGDVLKRKFSKRKLISLNVKLIRNLRT